MRVYYDFHIHSCLSPCGDDDATPTSVAGMAKLAGLDAVALCDHNTVGNAEVFMQACDAYGIVGIPGMELTTAEDIHLVCLFERLDDALAFGEEVERHRVLIPNRTELFGNQLLADIDDCYVGSEPHLLPNATRLPLEQAFELAHSYNAVCYPAHIDRISNGIIATLGAFPDRPDFRHAELHDPSLAEEYSKNYPPVAELTLLFGSDAHSLSAIPDAAAYIDIEGDDVRKGIFDYLGRNA